MTEEIRFGPCEPPERDINWLADRIRKELGMSYSFTITAANKDEAGEKVEAELARVVEGQPLHAADRQAAQDAAERFIDVVKDPGEGECITVSMSGSLIWQEADVYTGASVNVSAYVARKS